jgi:uncharacterized protein
MATTITDVWIQHPTLRMVNDEMFAPLRRWMGAPDRLEDAPPMAVTMAALDEAGVDSAIMSAWYGPRGDLISNDEVAQCCAAAPDRLRGVAGVDLSRPMDAVRELRRCVEDLGFVGLRMLPWLWEVPPTDRRFYPLYAACVELGVPFCTQVGHTGPLRPSEPGRPIPYIDQVAIDFPELVILCGHIGYPWTTEMIAVATKHENVFIDTSAYAANRYPVELVAYLRGHGRTKVMFGSNYPMIWPARALAGVPDLELDPETEQLFLSGNAARIFGKER